MSTHTEPGHREGVATTHSDEFDRELNVRGIVWAVVWLLVGAAVIHVLVWFLFVGFKRLEEAKDPVPQPIPAANESRIPPEPRLQAAPEQNLKALRAEEDRLLNRPAWIDEAQGVLRLPIEVAIDVLAEQGLPEAGGGQTPDQARQQLGEEGRPGRQPGGQPQMPGGSPPGAVGAADQGQDAPPPSPPPGGRR